ncbi:MAG: hydrogenase iron-sulfur subunit [Deltaproteobacteria bacterium]|nr:hydrogenase iron-sulfur subunit [Deltaproteobacteria bacterium]MBW2341038.1 hydrogenase iron-sulfur subunit [Deltaproteobacteria bacterium]
MSEFEPRIIAFCCHYCALAAADVAGKMGFQIPTNVRIIRVICTGKVEVLHLLKALEAGADGVVVISCKFGECYFKEGNFRAKKRVERAQSLIQEAGLEPERLMFDFVPGPGAKKFVDILNGITKKVRSLGPNPSVHQVMTIE